MGSYNLMCYIMYIIYFCTCTSYMICSRVLKNIVYLTGPELLHLFFSLSSLRGFINMAIWGCSTNKCYVFFFLSPLLHSYRDAWQVGQLPDHVAVCALPRQNWPRPQTMYTAVWTAVRRFHAGSLCGNQSVVVDWNWVVQETGDDKDHT